MIDEQDITEKAKLKKEGLERKNKLIQLSKDIKFESKMFPLEFKHNSKEELRYYLWMCELMKWLMENYFVDGESVNINPDSLEYDITEVIEYIINLNLIK